VEWERVWCAAYVSILSLCSEGWAWCRDVCSGWLVLALLGLVFAVAQAVKTGSDYWMNEWGNNTEREDYDETFWLVGSVLFVIAALASSVACMSIFVKVHVSAATSLHDGLFRRLLRAPVPTFFDVTPVGRIINRFSKDLNMVDKFLPEFLANVLYFGCNMVRRVQCATNYQSVILDYPIMLQIAVLVVATIASPYFLIIVPLVAFAFYKASLESGSKGCCRLSLLDMRRCKRRTA